MAPKSLSHRAGGAAARWQPLCLGHEPHRRATVAGRPGPAIDWPRTLLAKGPRPLAREHLRRRPEAPGPRCLHLVLIDSSGSMCRAGRLSLAKGFAAAVTERAARAAEDVALLHFGGAGVQWLQTPGPARRTGRRPLRSLGGGGGTPLTAALAVAQRLLRAARQRGTDAWLWLLTDGRSLETPPAPTQARHIVIVDLDDPAHGIGRCAVWAERWGAQHLRPRCSRPPPPRPPDRQPTHP